MGLGDFLKDQYKKQQQKRSDLQEARGEFLGRIKICYAGGFGKDYKNDAKRGLRETLTFYERRVEYSRGSNSFNIDGKYIDSVEVGGQELVTRSLFTGLKTKSKHANVLIKLDEGEQILFHTSLMSNFDAQQQLADAVSHYNSSQQPKRLGSSVDPVKEIARYAELHKQGVLTSEEFQAKKKQLLDLLVVAKQLYLVAFAARNYLVSHTHN